MARLRVLLIAEAANPEFTSVPLIGWSLSSALAQRVDAHLVTQVRNRAALERAGYREGEDYTALDSEPVARPIYRAQKQLRALTGLGWTLSTASQVLPYWYFEQLLWKRFGAAITAREFDVVHRITPLSPTTPSLIGARCREAGVPFVWGPINGGARWPRQFRSRLRAEGEWLAYVRDAYRLLPGYRQTRDSAAAILTGSRATLAQMPRRYHPRCVYVPENAIDQNRFAHAAASGGGDAPLRVAFVGRLVPFKGADMLIEAAEPLVRAGQLTLDIIGDGPEMPRLKQLVADRGLTAGVELPGWIAHARIADRLSRAQCFAFPSIREFGGGVVLEAMALGLAPLVADYAGPAELVTSSTGIRVPLGSQAELVQGFRTELAALAAEPERARAIGGRARNRALELFTWEAKAAQVCAVYDWVLGRGNKPRFAF